MILCAWCANEASEEVVFIPGKGLRTPKKANACYEHGLAIRTYMKKKETEAMTNARVLRGMGQTTIDEMLG